MNNNHEHTYIYLCISTAVSHLSPRVSHREHVQRNACIQLHKPCLSGRQSKLLQDHTSWLANGETEMVSAALRSYVCTVCIYVCMYVCMFECTYTHSKQCIESLLYIDESSSRLPQHHPAAGGLGQHGISQPPHAVHIARVHIHGGVQRYLLEAR